MTGQLPLPPSPVRGRSPASQRPPGVTRAIRQRAHPVGVLEVRSPPPRREPWLEVAKPLGVHPPDTLRGPTLHRSPQCVADGAAHKASAVSIAELVRRRGQRKDSRVPAPRVGRQAQLDELLVHRLPHQSETIGFAVLAAPGSMALSASTKSRFGEHSGSARRTSAIASSKGTPRSML